MGPRVVGHRRRGRIEQSAVEPLRYSACRLNVARVRDDDGPCSPDGGFEPEGARGVYKVRDGGVHAPRDRGASGSIRSKLMKNERFFESELTLLSQFVLLQTKDFHESNGVLFPRG